MPTDENPLFQEVLIVQALFVEAVVQIISLNKLGRSPAATAEEAHTWSSASRRTDTAS